MKYKYTKAKQVGGDDGYCWAVFVNGREAVNGLTRREAKYYRDKFERQQADATTLFPHLNVNGTLKPSAYLPDGVTIKPDILMALNNKLASGSIAVK